MTPQSDAATPPYLAFKTFRSAVQGLRTHGLPNVLDRTAWETKSGSDQSQILNALKFLKLIDDKGATQQSLKELVSIAEDSEEEREEISDLLRMSYDKVFRIDLKNATPKQLEDAIGSYGQTGVVRDRAVRFFLKAANHARIPLSTRLTGKMRERGDSSGETEENGDQSTPANGTPKPTAKGRRKRRPSSNPAFPGSVNPPPPPAQGAMKTIQLRKVDGRLSVTGDFNPMLLVGEERELVYKIVDLMTAYEEKKE